ncbi:MAG: GAF domain-containing protein [Acidobacteriota bacterium]|nr:GAF domain-containing protein [Acidobacteriota bacterium]
MAAQVLAILIEAVLVFGAVYTLVDYVRHRDAARFDIMLVFVSLATLIVAQEVAAARQMPAGVVRAIGTFAVLPQPWLLLRLVRHFRRVPRSLELAAITGLIVSVLIIGLAPISRPPVWTAFVVAYVVLVSGYATWAFVHGARTRVGVTRWRLRILASGSGALALAFIVSGLGAMAPALRPATTPIVSICLLAVLGSYGVGFVPPRLLRAAWLLPELQRFLQEEAECPPGERGTWMNLLLCQMAVRSVGGVAAVVAIAEPGGGRLVVRGTAGAGMMVESLDLDEGVAARAWAAGEPAFEADARRFGRMEGLLAAGTGAEALLAVPVASRDSRWGVLVVCLRRGLLFAADDMALLKIFSAQAANALDYAALVAEHETAAEELRRTAGQLEEANRELEAFSYSVSHDLRAPLRHVAGFAGLLRKADGEQLSGAGQRYLTTIVEATDRMGKLIEALLAFSRTGRSEMTWRRVALADLVPGIRLELDGAGGERCAWTVQPLPEVHGDAMLIRVALFNLVSNAVKYSRDQAQPAIEIGCRGTAGADGLVAIYVRDNGAGFDMRYAEKLFGVFQRLHAESEFEGTGIGLATVRRIVTRHGGRVWAEGAVGQGATFWIALPAVRPAEAAQAS